MSIAEAARSGIGLWVLAIMTSVAAGLQTLFEFLFLPFEIMINVTIEGANAFLIEPLGLIEFGLVESANAILGNLGLAGLPVSVIIVIITLLIAAFAVRFSITGGLVPNVFIDNPLVEFFFTTPEEEEEEGGD